MLPILGKAFSVSRLTYCSWLPRAWQFYYRHFRYCEANMLQAFGIIPQAHEMGVLLSVNMTVLGGVLPTEE